MTDTLHRYRVYGLEVCSNVELPCMNSAEIGTPSVSIRFIADDWPKLQTDDALIEYKTGFEIHCRLADSRRRIRYHDAAREADLEFLITAELDRVEVRWRGDTVVADIPRVLLGPLMGRLLRLRGGLVLHASAIAIGDAAILLCGESGSGKSTTTAALISAGHTLLSDDIATIEKRWLAVHHGYAQMRLLPDASAALGSGWQELPNVFAGSNMGGKVYRDLRSAQASFDKAPMPLRAIYFLEDRDASIASPAIHSLEPRRVPPRLIRNLYQREMIAHQELASMLPALASLSERVACCVVSMPEGLAYLPEIADALTQDALRR